MPLASVTAVPSFRRFRRLPENPGLFFAVLLERLDLGLERLKFLFH